MLRLENLSFEVNDEKGEKGYYRKEYYRPGKDGNQLCIPAAGAF